MKPAPLVSVVVPTYNRSTLLRETIASILGQTLQDFEIIIVDNMSDDDTAHQLASLGDSRIQHIKNPNYGVIAVNRNIGARRAVGKYVAFCDDDDLWMPDKLARQVAAMESDSEVALCYTNGCTFRGADVVHDRMVSRLAFDNHFRHLLWDNCIPSSSVVIRKTILETTGLIDEAPSLVAVEDYEMWLRIAHESKLVFLDEALIKYRLHQRSAGLKPRFVALRNVQVLKSVGRKVPVSPWLIYRAIAYQYAKHVYFRLVGK